MTTEVNSVPVQVADQDRELKFYTEVLGCELRVDVEMSPGARLVEVVPSACNVGLVLPRDSSLPLAVRMGMSYAETAYTQLQEAGVTLHNEGGNRLVVLEETAPIKDTA